MAKTFLPEDIRTPREKREYPYTLHECRGHWAIFYGNSVPGYMVARDDDRYKDEEIKEKVLAYMNQLNLEHSAEFGDQKEKATLQARMRELHKRRHNVVEA